MNVFGYAVTTEQNWKANLGEMTDWKPSYTFYSDFAIAEFCQVYMREKSAVKKTYSQVIKSWGSNYKSLTDAVKFSLETFTGMSVKRVHVDVVGIRV